MMYIMKNVKRKYEKSIFKTWLSCSIVNLFTVLFLTEIPKERGRGLICGVSSRLKERDRTGNCQGGYKRAQRTLHKTPISVSLESIAVV